MKFRHILNVTIITLFVSMGLSHSADKSLVFTAKNPLKIARTSETIELLWSDVQKRVPTLQPEKVKLTDMNTGKPVVTQLIDQNGDGAAESIIFQTNFAKDDPLKTYRLANGEPNTKRQPGKVYGRFVPERKDDFAWENDRIAFRIYGPALESELVSSGLDVWLKKVPYLVIEKWYAAGEGAYHKDSGEGLDLYTVGPSRGCGGCGIWDGQALQVSRNFRSWRVLASGPIRFTFELTYAPWTVNGRAISEIKRISLDAGQNLNAIESVFRADGINELAYGVGIAIHTPWPAQVGSSNEQGWLSRWETTPDNGSFGCGVVLDPANSLTSFTNDAANNLALGMAKANEPIRYFAGAGWDRSGQFLDRMAWETYLGQFSMRVHAPVEISFLSSSAEYQQQHGRIENWPDLVARSIMRQYPNPADLDVYGTGWTYTNGFFLHGLFNLGKKTGQEEYLTYVKKWVNAFLDSNGRLLKEQYDPEEFKLDDIEAGKVALLLYGHYGDKRYLTCCEQLVEQLQHQPRTHDGGYWHKRIYPWQMWLDGIYMADAFMLPYAAMTKSSVHTEEAIQQIKLITRHTQDPGSGLYFHGWDESKNPVWADPVTGSSPEVWGRALGWFFIALVDGLDYIPPDHPQKAVLIKQVQDLASRLCAFQDTVSGLWYQVVNKVDAKENWHESSCSAMFAYGLAKAADRGWIKKAYRNNAKAAFRGLVERHVYFDEKGLFHLTGTVKVGTLNFASSNGDFDYYVHTDRRIDDFKGVGAFFFAAQQLAAQ
jgi:unsaturated rhamnogalacturonyl hydrolase